MTEDFSQVIGSEHMASQRDAGGVGVLSSGMVGNAEPKPLAVKGGWLKMEMDKWPGQHSRIKVFA
eukprot:SAG11_NODE_1411_length_4995_cov_21.158088_1_plen_64_part_10